MPSPSRGTWRRHSAQDRCAADGRLLRSRDRGASGLRIAYRGSQARAYPQSVVARGDAVKDEAPAESLPLTRAGIVDRACDRYEAEWRAGRRPRIELFLADTPVHERPALFRELLLLELEFRKASGEQPVAAEYHARFPSYGSLVGSVFEPTDRDAISPKVLEGDTDQSLLFGILALQMDFTTRQGLIAAMQTWVADKS